MEKQNNHEYGQTDPDYIDQNTLVDGSNIQNEDLYQKKVTNNETISEFVESDPDYIDQETLVDNDNYAKEDDPYEYKKEFIEDFTNTDSHSESNENVKPENTNQAENASKTSDIKENDLNKDKE